MKIIGCAPNQDMLLLTTLRYSIIWTNRPISEAGLIEVISLKQIFTHQKKFLGLNPQCIPDVSIDPCQESIFCYTGQSRLIDMQEEQQIMVSHTIYYSRMIVQIWNSSKKIMIWIPICELGDFQHCFSVFEHGRTESRACCKLNMIL